MEPPASRQGSRARTRLRVALVGPLPPVVSGAGDHNRAVAGALGRICDLDVFAEPGSMQPSKPGRGYRNFHAGSFGSVLSPAGYDAVIYSIGNAPQHMLTYELAIRHPGIVWFHDVSLARLHLAYALERMDRAAARDYVRSTTVHLYKERSALQVVEGDDWENYGAWEAAGIRLLSELSGRSVGYIVGSELARSIVELDLGPFSPLPRSWVVPTAVPERSLGAVTGPVDDSPRLIVALGNLAPWTRPDILLEAVAILNRARPVRLEFVGAVDDEQARLLRARALALGLRDSVELTGCAAPRRVSRPGRAGYLRGPAAGRRTGVGVAGTRRCPGCPPARGHQRVGQPGDAGGHGGRSRSRHRPRPARHRHRHRPRR